MNLKGLTIQEIEKLKDKLLYEKTKISNNISYIDIQLKIKRKKHKPITDYELEQIKRICEENNVGMNFIFSQDRRPIFKKAKYDIAKHFRDLGYSFSRITYIMGYKQHGTIIAILNNK